MNHDALKRIQGYLACHRLLFRPDVMMDAFQGRGSSQEQHHELKASDVQALIDVAIGATARADEAEELRKMEASQASAWREVWQLLTEVSPEAVRAKGTGKECALAAIRSLAKAKAEEGVINTSTIRFSCVGELWHLQTQGGATLMRGVGEEFEATIRGNIK